MSFKAIGVQVYGVHKSYIDEKKNGGKIRVGKIKSYQNINGAILPIIKEVGTPVIICPVMHHIYDTLDEAITAIDVNRVSEKAVKKKRK